MKLKRGIYMLNIRHDDDCLFWQRDNFDDCNCNPEFEYVEVRDDNMAEVVDDYKTGERKAQICRALARKRN